MTAIAKRILPEASDIIAPDGSEVRVLAATRQGSMAHFKLHPGQVSKAVAHRGVEELWYVCAGEGRMWICNGTTEETIALHQGVSFAIPVGARFQFRCDSPAPLEAVGVTMPPWPGVDEAYAVKGKW